MVQTCPLFSLHAPKASQVLGVWQVTPVGSVVLATVTLQFPSEPQFRHWVQEATLQQEPSTQFPDKQLLAVLQVCPLYFLHTPDALQVLVTEQTVPVVSSALYTEVTHVPPAPVQFWHWGQLVPPQQYPSRHVPLSVRQSFGPPGQASPKARLHVVVQKADAQPAPLGQVAPKFLLHTPAPSQVQFV